MKIYFLFLFIALTLYSFVYSRAFSKISGGDVNGIGYSDLDSAKIISEATNGEFVSTSGLHDPECGGEYTAQILDLNKDGQPEVMVQIGQGCLTGIAGNHMELYIKDEYGKWNPQFGFDGFPNILNTSNKGFPDIEIAGPGFCFPVWRWNGEKYDIFKRCPDKF